MEKHGWTVRREDEIVKAHLNFDFIAENQTAIVFFKTARSESLRHEADALAGAIAAVTLQQSAGVKAWEAYLVLIVEDDYESADATAQVVQRDLDYCRKIVLNGQGIAASDDPWGSVEDSLSFLFPLDVAAVPGVEDVREYLTALIAEKGFDKNLVASLVNAFDSEVDCKCWDRVLSSQSAKADQ